MGKVDKGTKETRAKLTTDPIISLLKAKKIDLDHVNAVDDIYYAYRLITDEVSTIKVHVMERMSPSHKGEYQPQGQLRRIKDFQRWANVLREHDVDLSSALDIIVYRNSPHSVDRSRKRRNGTALKNLVDALNLYCRLRGWKQPLLPRPRPVH